MFVLFTLLKSGVADDRVVAGAGDGHAVDEVFVDSDFEAAVGGNALKEIHKRLDARQHLVCEVAVKIKIIIIINEWLVTVEKNAKVVLQCHVVVVAIKAASARVKGKAECVVAISKARKNGHVGVRVNAV